MPDRYDAIAYLTGKMTGGAAPTAVGKKFSPDGRPLKCPGYTTLCHVAPTSDAFAALLAAQDALKAGPLAAAYTFMPPASFHMTIFPGVIDYTRKSTDWPRGLDLAAPIPAAVADAQSRLAEVSLDRQFTVAPRGIFGGFTVDMTGADADEETKLRTARDRLQSATQIIRPDHDQYQFHITLGYLLRWLTADEAQQMVDLSDHLSKTLISAMPRLTLGPVEFCAFDDMHHFKPLTLL